MATLSSIIQQRISSQVATVLEEYADTTFPNYSEENIEDGSIWLKTGSFGGNAGVTQFCWQAPGSGTAIIETWGAGGGVSSGCCCGTAIAGNPGAYTKKTVEVEVGSRVCGNIGVSCNGPADICTPRKSTATQTVICSVTGCSCMCASGGMGGRWQCSVSNSMFCCIQSEFSYPGTQQGGSECGWICNTCCNACAYGGDVNHNGGFSCTYFGCSGSAVPPSCSCYAIPYAPGLVSTEGGTVVFNGSSCGSAATSCYSNPNNLSTALRSISNQSLGYAETSRCWAINFCACRDETGCTPSTPASFPALGGAVIGGQQFKGGHGGPGMVKIRFIG